MNDVASDMANCGRLGPYGVFLAEFVGRMFAFVAVALFAHRVSTLGRVQLPDVGAAAAALHGVAQACARLALLVFARAVCPNL